MPRLSNRFVFGARPDERSVVHQPWPDEIERDRAAAAVPARDHRLEIAALILSLCYACALFQRVALQGVDSLLAVEFGLGAAQLAGLEASFLWTCLLIMIPCGILVDTQGPRRMAIAGALLAAAGCALFSAARSPGQLTAASVAVAAGGSFAFVCMMRFIASAFPKRKATLSGGGIFVGHIGAIAASAPLVLVLAQLHWREVWAAIAVSWLVLALAVRSRIPPDQPERLASLRPDAIVFQLAQILGSPLTYVGIVVLAGLAGTYWAFATLVAPTLPALGRLSALQVGAGVSVLAIGYALGAACWGWLGDRRRREWLLALACALACATWLALGWIDSFSLTTAAVLLFAAGFGSGAFGLIYLVLTERNAPAHIGLVIAAVNSGIPLGVALAQSGAASLRGSGAMLPILVGSCVALAGAVLLCAARSPSLRRLRAQAASVPASARGERPHGREVGAFRVRLRLAGRGLATPIRG